MERDIIQADSKFLIAGGKETTQSGVKNRFVIGLAIFLLCLSAALFLAGVLLVLLVPAATRGLNGYDDDYRTGFILLTYAVLGTLIAVRHPKNPIGWILSAIGLSGQLQVFAIGYLVFAHYHFPNSFQIPLYVFSLLINVWIVPNAIGPLGFLGFPDGKLPSPRWRFFAWFPIFLGVLMYMIATPAPVSRITISAFHPPIAFLTGRIAPEILDTGAMIIVYLFDAMLIISAVGVLLKLRHAKGEQREQMKWCVYAGASSVFIFTCLAILFRLPIIHTVDPSAHNTNMLFLGIPADISQLVIPVAVFLAITKYRLYDIDLVINRTLVYIPLTAILAGLYAASVSLFQRLFIAYTGQKSDTAVVMSTLILAATFTPIKNSLQNIVDRSFKEPKDPLKELKSFGKQVGAVAEVLNTQRTTRRLLEISMEAYHASCGAIYLNRNGEMVLEHASKDWNEGNGVVSLPLMQDGVQLGALVLGTREDHKVYSLEDRRMLQREVDHVAELVWLTQVMSQEERLANMRAYDNSE